jgi:peptidoglycan hydrolase-like protein with peptidoglycan-binding domain
VLIATFIGALIVSGALSSSGSGASNIAISGGTQTLDPADPDSNGDGGNDVTESTNAESPAPAALYALGDSGDGVRELQARLRQLQWYQSDVTGEFDDVTFEAVQGFQAKRGLEPTGEVDQTTWANLTEMTSTPTDDEKHNQLAAGATIIGPGDEGDDVRELQARLKQIGWFEYEVTGNYGPITSAAVEGFQTRRGIAATGEVDQITWDALVDMTRTPSEAELNNDSPEPPATSSGLPEECMTGRVLCIDKTERVLRWVIDGQVQLTLTARFGSDPSPTREGTFEVYWKARKYNWQGTQMPYALVFDNGQAVHYSEDFDDNGYNGADDGSVNIGDEDAMAGLYDAVDRGDDVVIYRS